MTNWREDGDISGNFLSCKEGQKLRVKVKDIKKVVGGFSNFHYKKKDGNPILTKETKEPFHHELTSDDDRTLTIGAISLLAALRNAEVDPGMEIEINHSGRGKYEITILGTQTQDTAGIVNDGIPEDKEMPF